MQKQNNSKTQSHKENIEQQVDTLLSIDMDKIDHLEDLLCSQRMPDIMRSLLKVYVMALPEDSGSGLDREDADNLFIAYNFFLSIAE